MAWFLQGSSRNHTRGCAGGSLPSWVALRFLEAKMLLWPQAPLLWPSRRALSCEDDCSWEQLVWRIWMVKTCELRRYIPICWKWLCNGLWPFGILSALAWWSIWWSRSCWEMMTAFPSLPPFLRRRLQPCPRLLVCAQDLVHFLNLHMQLISLVKRTAFVCPYIHTCSLFRFNPQQLAFFTDLFEAFPLQRNNNEKTPTKQKSKKKTQTLNWSTVWNSCQKKSMLSLGKL